MAKTTIQAENAQEITLTHIDMNTGPQGPTGPVGPQGEQGDPGELGPSGINGLTGAVGDVGPSGSQGPSGATGSTGEKGDTGEGVHIVGQGTYAEIIAVADAAVGDIWITTDAGTDWNIGDGYAYQGGGVGDMYWLNTGPIQGPQGVPGEDGADGDSGGSNTLFQSTKPLESLYEAGQEWVRTTDMAKLTLYIQDNGASRYWVRELNGDGSDGVDGVDGTNGADGADGTNGNDGADGATGADGPIGATGPAGADGADSVVPGPIGATGPEGPIGTTGADGTNGTNGTDGTDGATGPQGPVGEAGNDGADGVAPVGYLGSNLQTGLAYTLVLADAGFIVEMNNADANTLTVPPEASVAFAVNTKIDLIQFGAGLTSIVAGAGVTIQGDLNSFGQYKGMSLWKRASDEWVLIGGVV